jgi:hypothetical protein
VTAVVLLHDLGAEEAGAPWRGAAPGWHAPDLPGHGAEPAPRHGAYDPMGPATLARWATAAAPDASLVVGVGQNAHAALILAAGRACGAVAIVDGLWGPWQSAVAAIEEMYDGLRRMLDDAGAVGPPPASGLDPRTRHGYGVHTSPGFARRFWGEVQVPVLAVETPMSRTPPAERAERVGWFGGPSAMVQLGTAAPTEIVAAVQGWWADCR